MQPEVFFCWIAGQGDQLKEGFRTLSHDCHPGDVARFVATHKHHLFRIGPNTLAEAVAAVSDIAWPAAVLAFSVWTLAAAGGRCRGQPRSEVSWPTDGGGHRQMQRGERCCCELKNGVSCHPIAC